MHIYCVPVQFDYCCVQDAAVPWWRLLLLAPVCDQPNNDFERAVHHDDAARTNRLRQIGSRIQARRSDRQLGDLPDAVVHCVQVLHVE